MRTPLLFAAAACLSGLVVLSLGPEARHLEPRDALSESAPINGEVQGLVQGLKIKASQEQDAASGQAIEKSAPQCLRLKAFRIEEEYRFLYRGTQEHPADVFKTGFVSKAEGKRDEASIAQDATLEKLRRHIKDKLPEAQDPYVSTSESPRIAARFGVLGWLYLIYTNRGVKVVSLARKAKTFPKYEEREITIPGHIPPGEIVGAWSWIADWQIKGWEQAGLSPMRLSEEYPMAQFSLFINNPHYSGPIHIHGNICPPNF